MNEAYTDLEFVQLAINTNSNTLKQELLTERYMQRRILKDTSTQLRSALAECQHKIKELKEYLKFLEEVKTEYDNGRLSV